jgi:hypothetical protein
VRGLHGLAFREGNFISRRTGACLASMVYPYHSPMHDALPGSGTPRERDDSNALAQGEAHPVSAAGPGTCPACGSPRVIPVLYGSPTSDLIAADAAGQVAIGGARAADGSARWECRDCDHRWTDAAPGDFG